MLMTYRINTQIIPLPSLHSLGRSTNQWETVIIVGWPPNIGAREEVLSTCRERVSICLAYFMSSLPWPLHHTLPHSAYHIHPPSLTCQLIPTFSPPDALSLNTANSHTHLLPTCSLTLYNFPVTLFFPTCPQIPYSLPYFFSLGLFLHPSQQLTPLLRPIPVPTCPWPHRIYTPTHTPPIYIHLHRPLVKTHTPSPFHTYSSLHPPFSLHHI